MCSKVGGFLNQGCQPGVTGPPLRSLRASQDLPISSFHHGRRNALVTLTSPSPQHGTSEGGEERSGADWVAANTGLPPRYLGPEPSAMSVEQRGLQRDRGARARPGAWPVWPVARRSRHRPARGRWPRLPVRDVALAARVRARHSSHGGAPRERDGVDDPRGGGAAGGHSEPTIAAVRGARPDGPIPAAPRPRLHRSCCARRAAWQTDLQAARRALSGGGGGADRHRRVLHAGAPTLNVFRIPAS